LLESLMAQEKQLNLGGEILWLNAAEDSDKPAREAARSRKW
jgi:hypothetical protein